MILVLLIRSRGVGKTAVALRLAGERARSKEHVAIIGADTAFFAAHLTINATPTAHGRIKITGFTHAIAVADVRRELITLVFPDSTGDAR